MHQPSDDELLQWLDELIEARDEVQAAAALDQSKRWLSRRWLVHPFNGTRHFQDDFFHTSFQELKNYPDKFQALMRMHPDSFQVLLNLVEMYISPKHKTKSAILAEQRLFITLTYLAHGTSVVLLATTNKIGESTVYKILDETCKGIFLALKENYVRFPAQPTWRNTANKFGQLWQLPGCLSAVDGKHVRLKAPDESGSLFHNYKKYFSTVLMAAVNHAYEFTWFSMGAYGGESDGGIFSRTDFGRDLDAGTLDIPQELFTLPGTDVKIPFFFVGDDAFALKSNFMKPYQRQNMTEIQKIFNYRLSRARRCVESAFGILVMRWRILDVSIGLQPDKADNIVNACICLHNFLSAMSDTYQDIEEYKTKQNDQESSEENAQVGEDENGPDGATVRDRLAEYFVSPQGQVPWQWDKVRQGSTAKNTLH